MPVKTNPTELVKCPCGLHKVVKIKAANAYSELTEYTCKKCKRVYSIIDHMNGCTIYYEK